MRIIELFAGIGACSKALENIGMDVEIVDAVEIDKYAMASFNAIHNTNFETQDITKWDKDFKDIDLIMHGSPCQDFSVAGKQAGGDVGSGTRSSLMYETIRIVGKLRPKYVVWENVKNLLSKKHKHNFDAYIETMKNLGYVSYYQVLNAKDYGIPQNRERVFTVSILGNENYEFPYKSAESNLSDFLEQDVNIKNKPSCDKAFEKEYEQIITSNKDIYQCDVSSGYQDCKVGIKVSPTIRANNNCTHILQRFEFPLKEELKIRLKDILEQEVDEKYYLKDYQIENIKKSTYIQNQRRIQEKDWCDTLCARDWKDPKCVEVVRQYGIFDTEESKHQAGSVYNKEGLAPTLDTMQGGWRQPCVEVVGNYMPSGHDASRIVDSNGTAPTVKENHGTVTATIENYKIRKLTPKECWRLMGFDDEDFEKAEKVNSNTQLYKQARKLNRGKSIRKNLYKLIERGLNV